jgi:Uma2 family endonuclease
MALKELTATETKPARLKMSYEAFLEWADEDTHAEWVNGEVIIHMPPKHIHQNTIGFLYELIRLFVRLFKLGEVCLAPFEVKLKPSKSSREPDIFFVATKNLDRLTEEQLNGPPDLIIEIVSTDSVQRDRDDKFKEYREAGVPEYWIIDPRPGKQRADFFHLDETGAYRLFATEDDERVESQILPGFWLRPTWLWQADTLDPLAVFFEMRGLSAEQAQYIQQMLRSGAGEAESSSKS